ncbi:hypothetical protein JCM3774_006504 [Rhodotorula dairenensis]
MPHPASRKFSTGRKGPRQVTGKRQVKGTLRPGPVAGPSRLRSAADEDEEEEDDDDDDNGAESDHSFDRDGQDGGVRGIRDRGKAYGYREALTREGRPLAGFKVCVSGCTAVKEDLWSVAVEYGAERHTGLLADTTHLVAETYDSEKYRVAVQHGILVMKPSWLWAVRAAWVSGEPVDYKKLENEHRLPALAGVVACLTQFARGAHKNTLKAELVRNGATVISELTTDVTHLIVASPSAPHSQTPSSDKLLQAQRNAHRLHPQLVVVWEGWVSASIICGGVRSDVTAQYRWREGACASENVKSTLGEVAGPPNPLGRLSAHVQEGERPQADADIRAGHFSSRDRLVERRPTPRIDCPVAAEDSKDPGRDANGSAPTSAVLKSDDARILKKRRLANPRADSSDLGLHVAWRPKDAEIAELEALPAVGRTERQFLPATRTIPRTANPLAPGPPGPPTKRQEGPGTVIRALGERRNGVWTGRGDGSPPAKTDGAVATSRSSVGRSSEASPKHDAGVGASDDTLQNPIFEGQAFALVNLKGPDPSKLADVITLYGGRAVIDPVAEAFSEVDWIVVDYAEPDEAFFRSADQRVVSICWLELCIYYDTLLAPADRLLERPLSFPCPVRGAEAICAHFSGFSEASPVLHHIRRFLSAVGATFSPKLSRQVTHLVFDGLDAANVDRTATANRTNPAKAAKAREWNIPIVSLRALREEVDQLAGDQQSAVHTADGPAAKGENFPDLPKQLELIPSFPEAGPVHNESRREDGVFVRNGERRTSEAAPAKAPKPDSEPRRVAKGLLRQQTSLLLAQLSDTDLGPAADPVKPRTISARARGQPREPDFLSCPPPPTRGSTTRLSPPATQDEDASLRIEYDNSVQAAARAQILKSLAEDAAGATSPESAAPTVPSRREARARSTRAR